MVDLRTSPPAAETAPARTRAYRDGALVADGFPTAELADRLAEPGTIVWVDLVDPPAEQLRAIADVLELHELAVEDALGPHQRPKLDHYAAHLFLTCHAVGLDTEAGRLEEAEVDAFLGGRWLVTVHGGGFPIEQVLRRWDAAADLAGHGVAFLVYGLLDVVVDGYSDVVEALDDYYDEVSDGIFAETPLAPAEQRHWFEMRRALVRLHRLVVPTREALGGLMRREHGAVPAALDPYFGDVYDHVVRVSESTDTLRELVSTIVETNLSLRDYRQNVVMKKVTSWAAIIAVPTLVTGYYGMNVPFPGSDHVWGVAVSSGLALLAAVVLYVVFRRKDWL